MALHFRGIDMHVRVRKNKSGSTSIFVVACKRFAGKRNPQPILVRSFGSSSDPAKITELYEEARKFAISTKYTPFLRINNEADIKECKVKTVGFEQLYGKIFERYFSTLDLGFSEADYQIMQQLVLMRIAQPVSKLKTSTIAVNFNCNVLSSNKIYKFMDKLTGVNIEKIKQHIFNNTKKLLGNKELRVLFYDLTTIYFENNTISELKRQGFSKDGKSQHVQISIALIVTKFGLLVGYEIFAGNVYEGKTLIPVLTKLRANYGINDVTIIADSAMFSSLNLNELTAHGFNYIVAARIKNLSNNLSKVLLNTADYQMLDHDISHKIVNLGDKYLVLCHSKKRAIKDAYERRVTITRLEKFLGKNVRDTMRGALKKPYVKLSKTSTIELDTEKLEYAAKFDGYFGFYTNTEAEARIVIEHYRGLWQVEQTFRITKHNLAIRPVYHYQDRRIAAHFAICFLALALLRTTEYLLTKTGHTVSAEQLHSLLQQIKSVEIINKRQKFYIMADPPPEIYPLYQALNIPKPQIFIAKNLDL